CPTFVRRWEWSVPQAGKTGGNTRVRIVVPMDDDAHARRCVSKNLMHIVSIDIRRRLTHRTTMRTTLTLDDDVVELAARQARARGLSLGKAVSDLVRRGLSAPTPSTE